MNPNKKAEELIEKFGNLAVDVVEEILAIYENFKKHPQTIYWQQLKQLIINKK